MTLVGFHRLPQQRIVARERLRHRAWELLPTMGGAFDIGEEESDGALGKCRLIAHDGSNHSSRIDNRQSRAPTLQTVNKILLTCGNPASFFWIRKSKIPHEIKQLPKGRTTMFKLLTRRTRLFLVIFLLAGLLIGIGTDSDIRPASAQAADSVILVVVDDLGVDALDSYGIGNLGAQTPTLDRMVEEGLLFRNTWAHPVCSPFRAAVLTGRQGFRTGVGAVVTGQTTGLPEAEITIPEALDAQPELGATHAAFGKWHLGNESNGGARSPNLAGGFSHYYGSLGNMSSGRGENNNINYYRWRETTNGQSQIVEGYSPSMIVDKAIEWLDGRTQPFFLYLPMHLPHSPFHAPPAKLHSVDLPSSEPGEGEDSRPWFRAMIEAIDSELGRLLGELSEEQRARTNIVFVGDNGTSGQVSSGPRVRGRAKGTLYQGGLHVPLIIHGPSVADPGREVEGLSGSVDLYGTVLDLMGAEASAWEGRTDSISLVPYLLDPAQASLRDWVFSEQFSAETEAADGKAIRDARFKYIRFDEGPEEFYDLLDDPYERTELIAAGLDTEAQAALENLRGKLDALLDSDLNATPGATSTAPPSETEAPEQTNTVPPAQTESSTPIATDDLARSGNIYLPALLAADRFDMIAQPTLLPQPTDIPVPTDAPMPTDTSEPIDTPIPTNSPVPTAEPTPTSGSVDEDPCPARHFLEVQAHPANSNYPDPELNAFCEDDLLVVESNGIPSFEFRRVTPNELVEQDYRWEIPLEPQMRNEPADIPLLGPVAIIADGLPIFGPNEAETHGFGDPFLDQILDFCNGHTAQAYHYHARPDCLWEGMENDPDLVLGFAFDGIPIMAPFACIDEDCSEIEKLESSWERTQDLRNAWDAHEYVEGSGDLDRCNGRVGPDGEYRYYATDSFPYLLGCYVAEPNSNRSGGGGGGGRPPRRP